MPRRQLMQYASQFNSIFMNNHTPDAALLSAGCTLAITEEVNFDSE
jgi:hypothetical protein